MLCTAFSSKKVGSCILPVNLLFNEFNSYRSQSNLFSARSGWRMHFTSRVVCDMISRGHHGEIRGLTVGGGPPGAMKDCRREARERPPRGAFRVAEARSAELRCSSTLWSPGLQLARWVGATAGGGESPGSPRFGRCLARVSSGVHAA